MIEFILNDTSDRQSMSGSSPFETTIDYGIEIKKRDDATAEWKLLDPTDRQTFNNRIDLYFQNKGVIDFKLPEVIKGKNLFLLEKEISAQIMEGNGLKILAIEELNHSSSLLELLENAENTEQIRELYRLRKRTVSSEKNSGINAAEANKLKNCMRQGRELYLSGYAGTFMVKPLSLFYSLTAYAYAIVILNNPLRYALESLPGSHGLNYLPADTKIQFGGDIKQGTFSELFTSFPTFKVIYKRASIVQNNKDSIMAFYNTRMTVGIGTLLSMVPEIRGYFNLVTGRLSRTFPLDLQTVSDARGASWEFQIGDGESRPSHIDIENSFTGFTHTERHGKTCVTVPLLEASKIKATIYTDIRGRLWYIENPFYPLILPELCLHFLLINSYSNIMRYSPDQWGDILLNHVKSDISLITRKYLSAFETKFPTLLLRSFSNYFPYVPSNGSE